MLQGHLREGAKEPGGAVSHFQRRLAFFLFKVKVEINNSDSDFHFLSRNDGRLKQSFGIINTFDLLFSSILCIFSIVLNRKP